MTDTHRLRARRLPIPSGYWTLPTGPNNAITDVPGVRVGHVTHIAGSGPLEPGKGPIRTGVTVVLPYTENLFQAKVPAAAHVINGFGKACGLIQAQELGQIETPIALTNTLSIWRAAEAIARWSIAHNPDIGISTSTVNPIALECNDGYLNDIQGNHITHADVFRAIENAVAQPDFHPVPEGNVGGGTGMVCFGWKGGIGTASRTFTFGGNTGGNSGSNTGQAMEAADQPHTYTLGALVQANFGRPGQLLFAGKKLPHWRDLVPQPGPPGSVVVILATDIPLDHRPLQRLCVRAAAGLARTGSSIDHGSGDFALAFSVGQRHAHQPVSKLENRPTVVAEGDLMHSLFLAVVEAVEESVLNALCAAETMTGRDDHIRYGLPLGRLADLLHTPAGE